MRGYYYLQAEPGCSTERDRCCRTAKDISVCTEVQRGTGIYRAGVRAAATRARSGTAAAAGAATATTAAVRRGRSCRDAGKNRGDRGDRDRGGHVDGYGRGSASAAAVATATTTNRDGNSDGTATATTWAAIAAEADRCGGSRVAKKRRGRGRECDGKGHERAEEHG